MIDGIESPWNCAFGCGKCLERGSASCFVLLVLTFLVGAGGLCISVFHRCVVRVYVLVCTCVCLRSHELGCVCTIVRVSVRACVEEQLFRYENKL